MPRIDDYWGKLSGVRFLSKIELKDGSQLMSTREGVEGEVIFKIQRGVYEWPMVSFGICDAINYSISLMQNGCRIQEYKVLPEGHYINLPTVRTIQN